MKNGRSPTTSLNPPLQRIMPESRTIEAVWYRSEPHTEPSAKDQFVRKRGRLIIANDGLSFQSPDMQFTIRHVQSIAYGVHGTMSNPSVDVRYSDEGVMKRAYFTDGGLGGFAGMFGGTRQLAEALDHLAPVTYEDTKPARSRAAILVGIAVLILVFIARVFF